LLSRLFAFLQHLKKTLACFPASQVLQLVDSFIHDDPSWLLFTTDISFDNLVVTQNENQVRAWDVASRDYLER
jgi:hypothetical protein